MKRMIAILSLVTIVAFSATTVEAGLFCKKKSRCCKTSRRSRCCPKPCTTSCYKPVCQSASPCGYVTGSSLGSVTNSVVLASPTSSIVTSTASVAGSDYQQVLNALTAYVQNTPDVSDVCSLKTKIPAYGSIIAGLGAGEKLQAQGLAICFPSEAVWNSRPEIRAQVIQVLTEAGVL